MASDKTPILESNREKSIDASSAPLPTPPATTQSAINLSKPKSSKHLEMTILTAAVDCNPWQHAPSPRRVRYDEVSKTLLAKGISANHHQIQVVIDKKLIQYYKYRSDPASNSQYLANKPKEFLQIMTKIASYISQLEMRRKKARSDGLNSVQQEESHNNDNHFDLSDSTAPSSPAIIEPTIPSRRRRSIHMEYKPQSNSEFMVSSTQNHPATPHQPIPLSSVYHPSHSSSEHYSSHKPNPFHDQSNHFTASTPTWQPSYSSSNGPPPQVNSHHPIQPKPLSHKSTPHPPSSLNNPPSVPSMPSRPQGNHSCCHHDCHKIQSKLFTPLKEFLEKKLEWDHAKLERENWRYEKQLEIENQQRARQIEIDREIRLREIEQRAMEVQLDRQVMDKFFKMMNEFMDQFNQNHDHSPSSQALQPPQPMMAPPVVSNRPVVVPGPNVPLSNPHTQPPHQPLLHNNKIKLTGQVKAPSISAPPTHPPPTHPSQLPPRPHSHHQSR